jgi:hypothetical protein
LNTLIFNLLSSECLIGGNARTESGDVRSAAHSGLGEAHLSTCECLLGATANLCPAPCAELTAWTKEIRRLPELLRDAKLRT